MKTSTIERTKTLAAGAALMAASLGLSGCFSISTNFDGETLEELDKSGDAPTEIGLAGPDDLILKVGKKLKIKVKGDEEAIEALRFRRSGDSLTIGRGGDGRSSRGKATITITMPAPTDISLAGSGDIRLATVADEADVSIAGSGKVTIAEVDASQLEVTSAGSGSVQAAGQASSLDINIFGSGAVDFAELQADDVEISIAGSGDINVMSNGKVDASIAGSGSVYVTGTAECTSSAMGSGKLTCKPA
ncbi:MAG: head GIN domain-containing protein [Pseudomonadota bacterium]